MDRALEDIVEECLEKWNAGEAPDERLTFFCDNFEKWMAQIPPKYHSTVLTLVRNLEYYSHEKTNQWLNELHRQLIEQSNITDDNTIFAFIKSKYGKNAWVIFIVSPVSLLGLPLIIKIFIVILSFYYSGN